MENLDEQNVVRFKRQQVVKHERKFGKRKKYSRGIKWCVCCDNKVACYIFAVIWLIYGAASTTLGIVFLLVDGVIDYPLLVAVCAILIIMGVSTLICTAIMLFGLCTEEPKHLRPIVFSVVIFAILYIVVSIILFTIGEIDYRIFLSAVKVVCVTVYTVITIRYYTAELKMKKDMVVHLDGSTNPTIADRLMERY